MSWKIANLCADRRFGSAARKQIIMFLADKAIQRHTELGESTVKRTISDFLREGILIETGRRPCKNGFTVIYRIVLARVMALESMAEPDEGTGSTVDPVQSEPGTGSTMDGVRGPGWTPNHPKTIHKPPTRKRAEAAAVEDKRFERIWAAYPKDRQRGKAAPCRPMPPRARGSRGPRSVSRTTGSSPGAGRCSSNESTPNAKRLKPTRRITTPGWSAGFVIAARCANTSPPRRWQRLWRRGW